MKCYYTNLALLLLFCAAATLCTSVAQEASPHRGGARKLLDGVQLQKFDSLVSLKRPDGSDITPASLYNSLRDTFNGYFAQEEAAGDNLASPFIVPSPAEGPSLAGPKEGRLLAQGAPATTTVTAAKSTPKVVDMTSSNMEKFMLSSRPPSARAKIEDPNAIEATFTGTGQLVSGGRKLSQSGRVSINPPQAQRESTPVTPGRVSVDTLRTGTTTSQQAAASGFLASRANVEAAPIVTQNAGNSRVQATLLAPPNANGKAKIEDPNAIEATFTGSGQPLSGGRKLSQSSAAMAPDASAAIAPVIAAALAPAPGQQVAFLASRPTVESAPSSQVVDMGNSQLQQTLLAPPNANGEGKIEGPMRPTAVYTGSGSSVATGRRLSQAAASAARKPAAATQQASASQFLASRSTINAAPTVTQNAGTSRVQATLLAPPNANGKAKIEDPNGIEATFTGSGQSVSGGRKLSQTAAAAKKTAPTQQGAASQFLVSRANTQAAPTVVDMRNSQMQATLLAPPNANGKAKMEDPNGVEATFSGTGQLLSGGRH